MKVGILVQQSFKDRFEAQALLKAFNDYGWNSQIITIEDIQLSVLPDNTIQIKWENNNLLKDFDVILVREIFSQSKFAITLIKILKKYGVRVIDNQLSVEQFVINKVRELSSLSIAGLPVPKTFYTLTIEQYEKMLPEIESSIGYPLLLKHNSMGKGSHIFKLSSRTDLLNKLKEIHNEDPRKGIKKYHIQEFLELKHDYRVLVIGNKVMGAMLRIPPKGDFRANFSIGGTVKPAELTPEMEELALQATNATNANFAGVDIVYTKDNKPYILEVNRTPGFKGFMKAFGIDIPHEYIRFIENYTKDA